MWAQSWLNVYDLVQPFPAQPSVDVTPALLQQNYTAARMMQVAVPAAARWLWRFG